MADQNEISSSTHHSKFKDRCFSNAGWGYRHQQCFVLFCVYIVTFSLKTSIGVALVAMTKKNESNMTQFQGENASMEFKPEGILNALILVPPYPTFNWEKKIQDMIIAGFYWGFMLLQLPAGYLVHRFGVRCLLTVTMTINCIVLIILPTVSYYGGWYSTVLCRVMQGLSQSIVAPAMHSFLGKWTPLNERGRLSTFVYGGQSFGIVLGVTLTGLISASVMGWPGSFRCYGIISGIMAVAIWFLIYDAPAKHPKISFVEKKYIEDDVGPRKKILPIPWMKILRDKGVHAMTISQIATLWGNMILYSEIPAYMDKIMKVNIRANGLLTALPFLVMWFASFILSWFTDWLIIKNILSVTNTRKVANSLGYIPAGVGMIALAYAPLNIYIVETLLVTICAFKISAICGFLVNHVDLSPNFAGTTIGIATFVSNMGTSFSPVVIGFILTDVEDKYLWRQVFCLTAGLYLVTNLIYVILGTGERAEWNDPVINEEEKDVEEVLPIMSKTE